MTSQMSIASSDVSAGSHINSLEGDAVFLDNKFIQTDRNPAYYYWEQAYISTGGCDLKTRIYGKVSAYPYKKALMYFQGDVNTSGSIRLKNTNLKEFIDAGFLVFVPDYRMVNFQFIKTAKPPACILAGDLPPWKITTQDAAHAFDSAIQLLSTTNIGVSSSLTNDPKMSVVGSSLGGWLAVWLSSQSSYSKKISATIV